jgi:hypothetical protein
MRVQHHIDDVGTAEVAGEVPSPVTRDLGQFIGLSPSPGPFAQTQRGYRDVGPPAPASALQLVCNGAGFYIDPRTFSHQLPLVLEGPSAGTARDHSTPAAVSRLSGFGQLQPPMPIRIHAGNDWSQGGAAIARGRTRGERSPKQPVNDQLRQRA